ncbi:hypothetical protein HK102_006874, partial [Quaeritorhiza haematococci]
SPSPATPRPRNFCVLPHPTTSHLFTKLGSPMPDEIDAHMYMFAPAVADGGEAYVRMVRAAAREVVEAVRRDKRRR